MKYKITLARQCWQYCEVEVEAESKTGAVNKLKYGSEDGQTSLAKIDEVWANINLDWGFPEPDDEIIWPDDPEDSDNVVSEREIIERKAYDEQTDEIVKRFDQSAADNANYGWGVDELGDLLSIATKVYRLGSPVLVTEVNLKTGEITHEWRS